VGHVLVEHDTIEHNAVLEKATWNLLDLGIALNIDLNVVTLLTVDSLDSLDGEVNDEVAPLGGELGADAAADDLLEVSLILDVNLLLFEYI
jgi:hypothetical protein